MDMIPNQSENSVPMDPRASNPTAAAKPRREKINMTKAGLTFSSPSAYLSHMHRCNFVYKKVPYTSVEQGYHHTHPVVEGKSDIAKTIMNTHNDCDLKDIVVNLTDSKEWNAMAPGLMWDLNEAKYSQNPPLMKRLLDTAPHKLIKASVDSKWGGACPFGSDIYEQGMIPGANLCGEQVTKHRNNVLAEMSQYKMS